MEIYECFTVHSLFASYIKNENKFQVLSFMWFSWDEDKHEDGNPGDGINAWEKIH